ncbi:unnamed protein product [Effrenium voratum]|nr:unnamed protein product [Effrenium voratum]
MEDLCIDGIEGVRRRRRQRGDDEEEDAEELYQSFLRAADKNEEIMWNKFIDSESPDFFQVLSIAQDGGFSEVHELWSNLRYLRAAISVAMLAANLITIVVNDAGYLFQATHMHLEQETDDGSPESYVNSIRNDYMISGMLVDALFKAFGKITERDIHMHSPRIALMSGFELVLLFVLLAKAVYCLIKMGTSEVERIRWSRADTFFWKVWPELTSFSAMRLLHYATPSVVIADTYYFSVYVGERGKHDGCLTSFRLWVGFVLKKFVCLILGVDAFLFKVRVAYRNIHREEIDLWNLVSVATFIMQVLGIVQLSIFVRGRIFLFIFGGEDSTMQPKEQALQKVWQAMLVRRIWKSMRWHQALAVLITFDEDDFQKLVLNEKADIAECFSEETSESSD